MNKTVKNKKIKVKAKEKNENTDESIQTDVLGSYTGVPKDKSDTPVQDADDL